MSSRVLACLKRLAMMHTAKVSIDFELFAQPRQLNSELLIRAEHNSRVEQELGTMLPTIEQAPVVGTTTIVLGRNPKQPARVAHLRLKAMSVILDVPCHHP